MCRDAKGDDMNTRVDVRAAHDEAPDESIYEIPSKSGSIWGQIAIKGVFLFAIVAWLNVSFELFVGRPIF